MKCPLLTHELSILQVTGWQSFIHTGLGTAPDDVSGPGQMLQHLQGDLQVPRSLPIRFRPHKLMISIAATQSTSGCAPKSFIPHPQNMSKYGVGTSAIEPNHSRSLCSECA